MVAFDQEVLLKNMIDTMLEEGNSRYPVYEENIDNIRGIVHYKVCTEIYDSESLG